MATVPDTWEATAAVTKSKPPRKPEEVWYDVHKHPGGVPGGMGRSPEHHLRNRGWTGHEINEGSGKKTIQYRNQRRPDFVISYGGGSSAKPDHNFRVLYMGTNSNVPKVTRAYSVAEAMNRAEELHQLQSGLVVQPMTHDSATLVSRTPSAPSTWRDMAEDDEHPIGPPKTDFPTSPERERDWPRKSKPQLQEIPPAPGQGRASPRHASSEGCPSCLRIYANRRALSVTWEDPVGR